MASETLMSELCEATILQGRKQEGNYRADDKIDFYLHKNDIAYIMTLKRVNKNVCVNKHTLSCCSAIMRLKLDLQLCNTPRQLK